MNDVKLIEMKKRLCSDAEFIYNGKGAAFLPIEKYVVGYDNEGIEFANFEDAINAKVFDGNSMYDIWDKISDQF